MIFNLTGPGSAPRAGLRADGDCAAHKLSGPAQSAEKKHLEPGGQRNGSAIHA
jgi:hypothetical protein